MIVNKKRYPGRISAMLLACYNKGVSAEDTARKLNDSATAKKYNVSYTKMSIAGTFSHMSRIAR